MDIQTDQCPLCKLGPIGRKFIEIDLSDGNPALDCFCFNRCYVEWRLHLQFQESKPITIHSKKNLTSDGQNTCISCGHKNIKKWVTNNTWKYNNRIQEIARCIKCKSQWSNFYMAHSYKFTSPGGPHSPLALKLLNGIKENFDQEVQRYHDGEIFEMPRWCAYYVKHHGWDFPEEPIWEKLTEERIQLIRRYSNFRKFNPGFRPDYTYKAKFCSHQKKGGFITTTNYYAIIRAFPYCLKAAFYDFYNKVTKGLQLKKNRKILFFYLCPPPSNNSLYEDYIEPNHESYGAISFEKNRLVLGRQVDMKFEHFLDHLEPTELFQSAPQTSFRNEQY